MGPIDASMRFGSAVSGKKEAVDRVAEMAIRFGMLDVVRLRNKIRKFDFAVTSNEGRSTGTLSKILL